LTLLQDLEALESVDISANTISDLRTLAGLTNLEELSLEDNPLDLLIGSDRYLVFSQIVETLAFNKRFRDLITAALETNSETGIDVGDVLPPYAILLDSGAPRYWRILESN
jgi:Leucine-rich repeat (LRR) protein